MNSYRPEEIIEKVKQGESLRKVELIGIDLTGADLKGADLEEANLHSAILDGAVLENANLCRAKLMGASLINTNLTNANLRKTDFETANMCNANMLKSKPHEADLEKCILRGACLRKTDLREADLKSADLRYADLRNANLSSAVLNNAILSHTNLTGANIWGMSHVGWQIDDIVADYIYIHEYPKEQENQEKFKYEFKPGAFEELYRSLPTIELLFKGGVHLNTLTQLIKLIGIINESHPDLAIDLHGIEKALFDVIVKLRLKKDDHLPIVADEISKLLTRHRRGGNKLSLPIPSQDQMPITTPQLSGGLVVMQGCTLNFINSRGESKWQGNTEHLSEAKYEMTNEKASVSDKLSIEYNQYFKEIHELFEIIRGQLNDNKQQLLVAFKQALDKKDEKMAFGIWQKLKEGIDTGTKAHALLSAIARFLKLIF